MADLPLIHVVGIGIAGADSLSLSVRSLVESAAVLVGAQRHLDALLDLTSSAAVEGWPLGDFSQTFEKMRSRLQSQPDTRIVVLASGDPLFFGLGRLLLSRFPAEQLVFHPHISAIQLAFSRLKMPWQDATLVSVHGRGEALLLKALKRGDEKIALLTDDVMTPGAIARLILALDSPAHYQMWVCENLGGTRESVGQYPLEVAQSKTFSALNVVVLRRQLEQRSLPASSLPLIGLPDSTFSGFPDRPTLMTKREIRLLILGELAPVDGQVIWDIGAGTGSVSIELSRLCPNARIYAVEKTAAGASLISRNAQRLAMGSINVVQGNAPKALSGLPFPSCVFIGGSSGQLLSILNFLNQIYPGQISEDSGRGSNTLRIVIALATVEHLSQAIAWATQSDIASRWTYQLTQINISRSVPVGGLTRFSPINPVTLVSFRAL